MDATSKIEFTPMRLPAVSWPQPASPYMGGPTPVARPLPPSGRIYHWAHAPSGCLGGFVASPLVAPGCGGGGISPLDRQPDWLRVPLTPLAMGGAWEAHGLSSGPEADVSMTPPPAGHGKDTLTPLQREGGGSDDCATEMSVDLVSSAVSRLQLRERHFASGAPSLDYAMMETSPLMMMMTATATATGPPHPGDAAARAGGAAVSNVSALSHGGKPATIPAATRPSARALSTPKTARSTEEEVLTLMAQPEPENEEGHGGCQSASGASGVHPQQLSFEEGDSVSDVGDESGDEMRLEDLPTLTPVAGSPAEAALWHAAAVGSGLEYGMTPISEVLALMQSPNSASLEDD